MYKLSGLLGLAALGYSAYLKYTGCKCGWAIVTGLVLAYALLWTYFNGGTNQHWPSLEGKTILVTGANSGIGYSAAEEMAKLGPKNLILACRNKGRGLAAEKSIRKVVKDPSKTNVVFM